MLPLLLACTSPEAPADVQALTATLTDMPTVVRVQWRSEAATRAVVTGRFDDDAVTVEEAAATTDHAVLLAGIPADTRVTIEVADPATTTDPAAPATPATTITTGPLPSWLPDTTFSADEPDAAEGGYTITPMIDLEGGGLLVFDHAGRPVWAWKRTDTAVGSLSRARLSRDGRALLYDTMSTSIDDRGLLVRVPLDGSAATELPIAGIHTDFVELPDGGYAALGWELYTLDSGQVIIGDTIVEFADVNEVRTVWSVFDDFTPPPDGPFENFYPGDPDVMDWSHVNSLTYDEDSDDYYVTGTWNHSVLRVDRGTGDLVWRLSDDGGDFTGVGEGRLAWHPHSVEPTDEGLVVFNRGDPSDRSSCSESTDIALDLAAQTAERVRGYGSEACILVPFLGSAQRLAGGNTLVAWSTAGQLDEATPDGALAWRVRSPIGSGFGFAVRVPKLGSGAP